MIKKYAILVIAAVLGGEGYLLIEELRSYRQAVERGIEVVEAGTRMLSVVSQQQVHLTNAAQQTGKQCSGATKELTKVTEKVEEVRREVERIRKKLRLETKVLGESTDK